MRKKKEIITENITLDKAEGFFADYAEADAKIQKITGQMDVELTKIREKYQDRLADFSEAREKAFEKLQHYAQSHPESFVKKKSLEMAHGMIGFRTGTPSVKTLKGYTWQSVLNLVKEFMPSFVRSKEEVNKELILDSRDNQDVVSLFPKCGIKIEQSETFFVEPKKEMATA